MTNERGKQRYTNPYAYTLVEAHDDLNLNFESMDHTTHGGPKEEVDLQTKQIKGGTIISTLQNQKVKENYKCHSTTNIEIEIEKRETGYWGSQQQWSSFVANYYLIKKKKKAFSSFVAENAFHLMATCALINWGRTNKSNLTWQVMSY